MVVFVGFLMVLVSALYPGANAAWGTLEATVQTGPNLPTAQSPNLIRTFFNTVPISNASVGTTYQPFAVHDCTMAAYWQCITTQPFGGNASSFATLKQGVAGTVNMSVNMQVAQPVPPAYQIAYIQVGAICSNDLVGKFLFVSFWRNINNHTGSPFYTAQLFCPFGQTRGFAFWNDTTPSEQVGTLSMADFGFSTALIFGDIHAEYNISELIVSFGVTAMVSCQGGGLLNANAVACQIGNAVTQFVNFMVGIGAGIVFVLSLIVGLFVFVVQLMVGVLVGFMGTLFYFFNLPGAPSFVQALIDAIFVGFLIVLSLLIIDRAVGLFGGAVNKT